MSHLSEDLCNDIISALQGRIASSEAARRFDVSKSAVNNIRSKYGSDIPKSSGGRPASLSRQDKSHCIRSITSGKLKSAAAATKALQNELNVVVSERTVRRALQDTGMEATPKDKRPKLSAKNIKDRLEFAKCHKDWTIADWKRVIFSDESKISRFCSDGMSWCWKRHGDNLQEHQIRQTVKNGRGNIMIWGCMTYDGPGFMWKLQGTMSQYLYLNILKDELQQAMEYYDFDPAKVVFQQDNAPCHKAASVDAWFKTQAFEVMGWPPQSPRLEPNRNALGDPQMST
jgi:transposase